MRNIYTTQNKKCITDSKPEIITYETPAIITKKVLLDEPPAEVDSDKIIDSE